MTEPEAIRSLRGLLRAMGCESLRDVELKVDDEVDALAWVRAIGPFALDGIEIQIDCRGTELRYPFTRTVFWSVVESLATEWQAALAYETLAEQIEEVEGFPVRVDIDYDCNETSVKPSQQRRQLESDVVVQFPGDYPYQRPMSGQETLADWISDRFHRHFTGLEIRLAPPADGLPLTTTLADLRQWVAGDVRSGPAPGGVHQRCTSALRNLGTDRLVAHRLHLECLECRTPDGLPLDPSVGRAPEQDHCCLRR